MRGFELKAKVELLDVVESTVKRKKYGMVRAHCITEMEFK